MLIVRCRRLLFHVIARRLEEVGESVHLYRLLSELARNGPAPQCDLAEATAQHAAAVSRLVDELHDAGLIRRRRGNRDRRQIIVAITPAGRRRYEAVRPVVGAAIEEVMSPLAQAQRHRLAELLGALLGAHRSGLPEPGSPPARAPARTVGRSRGRPRSGLRPNARPSPARGGAGRGRSATLSQGDGRRKAERAR